MRPEALDEESSGIASYSNLIRSSRRIVENAVEITTLEGDVLHAEITDEGWLAKSGRCFPTLEALSQTESPQFNTLWNKELYNKSATLKHKEDAKD